MNRTLQYFHSVVEEGSFSKAADACHISQSAISQQIQALERELGFQLLERKNRTFFLTDAGKYYYDRTKVLVREMDQAAEEARQIAAGKQKSLRLGFLRSYSGPEFQKALELFMEKYPSMDVEVRYGNHEELYEWLRTGEADLVFNDQRRKFSDLYCNLLLGTLNISAQISRRSPLASQEVLHLEDLSQIPCIVISASGQRETEEDFYRQIIGVSSPVLHAGSLEEARAMVLGQRGFLLVEGDSDSEQGSSSLIRIPLYFQNRPVQRNYCAFWKTDNSGYFVETFAQILQEQFAKTN